MAQKAQNGDTTTVWQLARALRMTRKRPKLPPLPVRDAQGRAITNEAELTELWIQQFSEEFSNQVTRVAQLGLERLLSERQSQSASSKLVQIAHDGHDPNSAVPTTLEEWFDFFAVPGSKVQEGTASGQGQDTK